MNFLSDYRKNSRYDGMSDQQIAAAVYDENPQYQNFKFEDFYSVFDDTVAAPDTSMAAPVATAVPQSLAPEDNSHAASRRIDHGVQANTVGDEDYSWGQFGSDAVDAAQHGFFGAAADFSEFVDQGITWATGEEFKTGATKVLRNSAASNMDEMSKEGRDRMQGFRVETDDGLGLSDDSTWAGFGLNAMSGVGSSAAFMVPGGIIGKGLGMAGKGLGLAKSSNALMRTAPMATGFATTNAMTIGGGAFDSAYQGVLQADLATLNESDEYKKAYWDIADALEANGEKVDKKLVSAAAKKAVATDAGRRAMAQGFGLGFTTGIAAGVPIINLALGRSKAGFIKAIGYGALTEGVQETIESGGESYITNTALRDYVDSNIDATKGVVADALTGGLVGMGAGGGTTAGGRMVARVTGQNNVQAEYDEIKAKLEAENLDDRVETEDTDQLDTSEVDLGENKVDSEKTEATTEESIDATQEAAEAAAAQTEAMPIVETETAKVEEQATPTVETETKVIDNAAVLPETVDALEKIGTTVDGVSEEISGWSSIRQNAGLNEEQDAVASVILVGLGRLKKATSAVEAQAIRRGINRAILNYETTVNELGADKEAATAVESPILDMIDKWTDKLIELREETTGQVDEVRESAYEQLLFELNEARDKSLTRKEVYELLVEMEDVQRQIENVPKNSEELADIRSGATPSTSEFRHRLKEAIAEAKEDLLILQEKDNKEAAKKKFVADAIALAAEEQENAPKQLPESTKAQRVDERLRQAEERSAERQREAGLEDTRQATAKDERRKAEEIEAANERDLEVETWRAKNDPTIATEQEENWEAANEIIDPTIAKEAVRAVMASTIPALRQKSQATPEPEGQTGPQKTKATKAARTAARLTADNLKGSSDPKMAASIIERTHKEVLGEHGPRAAGIFLDKVTEDLGLDRTFAPNAQELYNEYVENLNPKLKPLSFEVFKQTMLTPDTAIEPTKVETVEEAVDPVVEEIEEVVAEEKPKKKAAKKKPTKKKAKEEAPKKKPTKKSATKKEETEADGEDIFAGLTPDQIALEKENMKAESLRMMGIYSDEEMEVIKADPELRAKYEEVFGPIDEDPDPEPPKPTKKKATKKGEKVKAKAKAKKEAKKKTTKKKPVKKAEKEKLDEELDDAMQSIAETFKSKKAEPETTEAPEQETVVAEQVEEQAGDNATEAKKTKAKKEQEAVEKANPVLDEFIEDLKKLAAGAPLEVIEAAESEGAVAHLDNIDSEMSLPQFHSMLKNRFSEIPETFKFNRVDEFIASEDGKHQFVFAASGKRLLALYADEWGKAMNFGDEATARNQMGKLKKEDIHSRLVKVGDQFYINRMLPLTNLQTRSKESMLVSYETRGGANSAKGSITKGEKYSLKTFVRTIQLANGRWGLGITLNDLTMLGRIENELAGNVTHQISIAEAVARQDEALSKTDTGAPVFFDVKGINPKAIVNYDPDKIESGKYSPEERKVHLLITNVIEEGRLLANKAASTMRTEGNDEVVYVSAMLGEKSFYDYLEVGEDTVIIGPSKMLKAALDGQRIVQRDENGKIIKDKDGKTKPVVAVELENGDGIVLRKDDAERFLANRKHSYIYFKVGFDESAITAITDGYTSGALTTRAETNEVFSALMSQLRVMRAELKEPEATETKDEENSQASLKNEVEEVEAKLEDAKLDAVVVDAKDSVLFDEQPITEVEENELLVGKNPTAPEGISEVDFGANSSVAQIDDLDWDLKLTSKDGEGVPFVMVDAIARKFFAQMKGIPGLEYKIHRLTDAQREGLKGSAPTGAFDPRTNTVHLFPENFQSPAEVVEVLRHEIIAHYGLAVIPDTNDRNYIINMIRNAEEHSDVVGNEWRKVRLDYAERVSLWEERGDQSEVIEARLAEEVFARMAEVDNRNAVDRLWNRIKSVFFSLLRKFGLMGYYTQSDIHNVLDGFAKRIGNMTEETAVDLTAANATVMMSIVKGGKGTDSKQADLSDQPLARPDAVEVDSDIIPRTVKKNVGAFYGDSLDEDQQFGVSLAIDTFLVKHKRGFMLADGTGFGKTRQILGIADLYMRISKLPVLVVSESEKILKKNFAADAAAMGIDLSSFQTTTYSKLSETISRKDDVDLYTPSKEFSGEYGLVIFDEAHNMKNRLTQRAQVGKLISKKARNILYATASPMDKIASGSYYISELMNEPYEKVLAELGFREIVPEKRWDRKEGKWKQPNPELERLPNHDWDMTFKKLEEYRRYMTKNGLLIKRFYPFFGKVVEEEVWMSPQELLEQKTIDEAYAKQLKAIRYNKELTTQQKKQQLILKGGQRTLELGRWEEILKLDKTVELINSELAAGRSVVVMAASVGAEQKVKKLNMVREGFTMALAERLNEQGVDFVELHSKSGSKTEQMAVLDKFQSNQSRVLITTPSSGGTGINLDDHTGEAPRTMIIVTKAWGGDKVVQMLGRVSRKSTVSPAKLITISLPEGIHDQKKAKTVARKLAILTAASGEESILQENTGLVDDPSIIDPTTNTGGVKPATPIMAPTLIKEDMEKIRALGIDWRVTTMGKKKTEYRAVTVPLALREEMTAIMKKLYPTEKTTIWRSIRKDGTYVVFANKWTQFMDLLRMDVLRSQVSNGNAQRGKSGHSVEQVEGWLGKKGINKMRALGHRIVVVQSISDVPAALNKSDRGAYVVSENTSYIVADNVHTKKEARQVFMHEVVGHQGLITMLGQGFGLLSDRIQDLKSKGDETIVEMADLVYERYGHLDPETESAEIISAMAETMVDQGFMYKIFEIIRRWVKKLLGSSYVASASDVRSLIMDAGRYMVEANAENGLKPSIANTLFSRVSPNNTQGIGHVYSDTIESAHNTLATSVKNGMKKIGANATAQKTRLRIALGALTNEQIERGSTNLFNWKGTNPLRQMNKLLRQFRVEKERAVHGFEVEEKIWDQLSQIEANTLARLMRDATMAGIHPDKPIADKVHDYLREDKGLLEGLKAAKNISEKDMKRIKSIERRLKEALAEHKRLSVIYKSFNKKQSTIYTDVRDMMKETWLAETEALTARIDRQVEKSPASNKLKRRLEDQMKAIIKRGPYFPLSRFGDYVVTAWADINGEREVVREQFDSKGEAEAALKFYKENWGDARLSLQTDDMASTDISSVFKFKDELMTLLNKNTERVMNDSAATNEEQAAAQEQSAILSQQINNLLLNAMPSNSIMQRHRHRLGTKGASSDMRRSVQNLMLSHAANIARITYGDRIQNQLNVMKDELRMFRYGGSQIEQEDAIETSLIYDEMQKRVNVTMKPTGRGWASNANRFSFIAYLGWSPAAALVNISQIPAFAIPVVAARYGYVKTSAIFAKTAADWMSGNTTLNTRENFKSFTREGNRNVSEDERRFIELLTARGDIDITRLGSITEEAHTDQRSPSAMPLGIQKALRTSAYMFHNAEMFNREVTGLAAYRLIKKAKPELFKEGGKFYGDNMTENEEAIYEEVREMISESQFVYEAENRPRYMRESDIVKVATQFKIYPQHVIMLYYQTMKEALGKGRGEDAQFKREAIRKLTGLTVMGVILGGLTGTALTVTLSAALEAIMTAVDPDDDEFEYRDLVRNGADWFAEEYVPEEHQDFVKTFISKGVVNAMGVDLHSRISQSEEMITRLGDKDFSSGRDFMAYLVLEWVAGASGGLLSNIAYAVHDMDSPGLDNRLVSGTPVKAIKDVWKSARYATDGIDTQAGAEVMNANEFNYFDIVIQMMGFTPNIVSEMYGKRNRLNDEKQQITDRVRRINNFFYQGMLEGETDKLDTALKEMQDHNEMVIDIISEYPLAADHTKSLLITPDKIMDSIKATLRSRVSSIDGIYLPKSYWYLIEKLDM